MLSRNDITYAGRDTVNEAAKVAPRIFKIATNDINNNITEPRLNHVISQGGKEIERVLPKVLGRAIEDVHHTPFRLFRNFGKNQFNKLRRKILRR